VDGGAVVKKWSFSTAQAVVGLVTGVISIVGAAYSAVDTFRAAPAPGAIVAVVRDSADKPIPSAVVEVLGPENAIVTTMIPGDDGVVRRAVVAGAYRVRVVHPDFVETERDVKVDPDTATEVNFVLASRPGSAAPARAQRSSRDAQPRARRSPTGEIANVVDRESRRLLGRLGF
jgi:hypothetical protein